MYGIYLHWNEHLCSDCSCGVGYEAVTFKIFLLKVKDVTDMIVSYKAKKFTPEININVFHKDNYEKDKNMMDYCF